MTQAVSPYTQPLHSLADQRPDQQLTSFVPDQRPDQQLTSFVPDQPSIASSLPTFTPGEKAKDQVMFSPERGEHMRWNDQKNDWEPLLMTQVVCNNEQNWYGRR